MSDPAIEAVEFALRAVTGAGAHEADVVLVENDSLETRVRGEEIDFVKQAREHTLGIRALVRGKAGTRAAITSTSDLAPAAIERMAADAAGLAQATAEDPLGGLPEGGFATDWEALDLDLADRDAPRPSADARIEAAMAAEAAARAVDPRIRNSEGSQAGSDHSRIVLANSRGFLGHYETSSHSLFSEPLAEENGAKQRDYWMSVSHHLADLESPEEVGRRAAERALRRLGARPVPTCEVPVIFDPITAPSLLRQLAGCVSGYAVYRKSTFLADKLGERIGSDALTVIDDGRRLGGLGSRPFDGEGLPTRRNAVVEQGRLATFLLDSYSARKVGGASTGSASRGAGSAPGVAPSNLWLEPGKETQAELIARTERGLLVTELIGQGFNPVTGDYSRGAAGLWIEGGEIAYPVEEITIAGNFGDMLRDIDGVADDLLWLGRVACPSLRVSKLTVAGAA